MMEDMYKDRKKFKNLMIDAEKKLEEVKKELRKRGLKHD
jgi:hypothetical protein